jgi:DNA-binding MarR family transcriptional regulator
MAKNTRDLSQDLYNKVWEALLKQQRKSRFLAAAAGFESGAERSDINFAEALLLLIVQSQSDRSIGEIAAQLTLERSWVSRMVISLEKRGLVSSQGSKGDQRIRNVRITKKGVSELEQVLRVRAEVVTQVYKGLTQEEQNEVQRLLKKLADGSGAPPYLTRVNMHPIDAELARFSWRAGVIGDNVMESGISVTKYQVLFALARHKDELISPSDLGKLFPVNLSSVSRLISSLEREGMIKRTKSSEDGRVSLLQISQKGLALCQDMRQKAVKKVSEALAGVPLGEVKRLSDLILKATGDFVGKLSHHPRKTTDIRAIQPGEVRGLLAAVPKSRQPGLKGIENALSKPHEARLFGFFREGVLASLLSLARGSSGPGFKEIQLWGSELEEIDLIRFLRVSMQAVSSGLVER